MTSPVRIDAPDLSRLLKEMKAVDAKVTTNLRKQIREAAKVAAEDVKRTVLQAPPNDRPGTVGTRAAIASGISVRIGTATKGAKVSIVGSSKNLPAERKPMMRLYNKPNGWRHPVYWQTRRAKGIRGVFGGRTKVWVHQQGRPYFDKVLDHHRDNVQRTVVRVMDDINARLLATPTK